MSDGTVYDKVWNLLLRVVREEVRQTNASAVGRRVGKNPSTIIRWVNEETGAQGISLKDALEVIVKLGVPMSEVLEALSPDKAARIALLLENAPELLEKLCVIVESGDKRSIAKVDSDLDFMASTIKKD